MVKKIIALALFSSMMLIGVCKDNVVKANNDVLKNINSNNEIVIENFKKEFDINKQLNILDVEKSIKESLVNFEYININKKRNINDIMIEEDEVIASSYFQNGYINMYSDNTYSVTIQDTQRLGVYNYMAVSNRYLYNGMGVRAFEFHISANISCNAKKVWMNGNPTRTAKVISSSWLNSFVNRYNATFYVKNGVGIEQSGIYRSAGSDRSYLHRMSINQICKTNTVFGG
ncbi:hypothetical protein [Mycoplasma sp. P36-A1]|uniref:hypothetical protein n=1 Tax=Mycoplasma sp. P36-A1 TaxID=3252900 RepID=UPI003C2DE14A